MSGGYDEGYLSCPCFWGESPGSLIKIIDEKLDYSSTLSVLDLGCGEGKNAIFFARKGAVVRAIDVSEVALRNAKRAWPDYMSVTWECADIRETKLPDCTYDIVISYGLFHCIETDEILREIRKIQSATKKGGINVLCAFNDRHQDLSAHPGFEPTLMPHNFYIDAYLGWNFLHESDEDLFETHPHNNIPHSHALTRLIIKKA